MKFIAYLKDKLYSIIIYLVTMLLIMAFLSVVGTHLSFIIAVEILCLLAWISITVIDYSRKKNFYNEIINKVDTLDQAYLVNEIVEEPNFYEGKIFYEIIQTTDKSMYENVAKAKRYSTDFKEYIEMWIHEVKLPIASLVLKANNMKMNDEEGESESEGFSEILNRLNNMIDQVLYYARSENSEKDYIFKEVKLGKVINSVLQRNRLDIQARDVELDVRDVSESVLTDAKWMEFIIGQFLSNSLRYTAGKKQPKISIYSEKSGDDIILHFKDNGIGIPKEDIKNVWEKSFTGSNGRWETDSSGNMSSTGMGLYIVRNLCNKMGHKVAVESVQGEFTDFMIYFGKNDMYKIGDK
ncbi:sensor histidine kinase [Eubacterium ruminantium]|uniref:sensor histidine kinase n=1 Tax=Eubacterium ruminantium TaxID=42322 RepID=UPI001568517B|nr:sensor histidine kinase [Eubacterium ruminantium]